MKPDMATTVWKGELAFGLVNVAVRLYRAARKERIPLHYLAAASPPVRHAGGREPEGEHDVRDSRPSATVSRVTETVATQEENARPIPRAELLRGHEVAKDQFVTFTSKELSGLRPETSKRMEIVRSVRLDEIDPVYLETSYYVVPDRGGERAYSLLFSALQETRYVVLATVTMHGREHVVIVRPGAKGLLAHTMFYQDELRAESEFDTKAEAAQVAPKELQLAKSLVEAIAGPFSPAEFKDTWREKLQAMIDAKTARQEISPGATAAPNAAPPRPAVDIMEALRRSLAEAVPKRQPGRVTEITRKSRKRV